MAILAVDRVHGGGGQLPPLRGVSFEIAGPAIVAVVGPSGAGKETIVSVIGGRTRPSSGRVLVSGRTLDELPIGTAACVISRPPVAHDRSLWQNVLDRLPAPADRSIYAQARHLQRISDVLDYLKLDAEAPPGQIESAGRVIALVEALYRRPPRVLALHSRRFNPHLLRRIVDDFQAVVLYACHDLDYPPADAQDDYVIHLNDGRLVD